MISDKSMKSQIKKAYDGLAKHYHKLRKEDSSVKFYKEILETPFLLKLVGDVKNKNVLDLGCGPGIHAKILTKKGAKVIGIDNSKESIKLAKTESPKSTFIVGDIEKLQFKSREFDVVFSAMVLGHFKNWTKILNEVNRVLKKDGIFVFSIYNPFKEVLTKVAWEGKEFRIVKNYFDERLIYSEWKNEKKSFTVSHHHKTYATIIKFIMKHGFELVDYEDCKPPKSAEQKYLNKYGETMDLPNFCVWKLKKK
ncbi:class I SAM-dependent methyltransferase [Candidatus Woesearchaeota archaeon]|nr:class I SAM-dependent methyltransferase [Candidatus Woesearchaeota archaeon]